MAKENISVENTTRLSTANVKTEAQKALGISLKAGEITEEGIMCQFISVEQSEGKHGKFWFIHCRDQDGKDMEILTSSKTLMTLINENYQLLVNKIICISATGQGFERIYNIEIIAPGKPK